MDHAERAQRRNARRRRGGTVLAMLGAVATLIGLVALPLTEPARHVEPFGDVRLWAVSLFLSGIAFVAVGLFVRATPAPAPITRPRRFFLWAAGFLLIGPVGLALSDSDRHWTHYSWSAGLAVLYVGVYLYEWWVVRRRRAEETADDIGAPGESTHVPDDERA